MAGNLNLSLCNEVIADRPFEAQCEFAALAGYQGLEIAPFTLGGDPRTLSDRAVAKVAKALKDAGIVATGLHWLLVEPEGLSITSADKNVRRNTFEVMARNIDLCAELGGAVLVHGSPQQRSYAPDDDPQEALRRALDLFAEIASKAEQASVIYCLEPLSAAETNFINRIEQAVEIVEELGSPAFRTMLDTSAAAQSETDPIADLVRTWMPTGHLAHVQFNDRNRKAAGQGDDQFLPVLKALKDTGYDGVIAMEPFIYEPDRSGCAAFALGYVRGLWEALA